MIKYSVNKIKYIMLPSIITIILIVYFEFIYSKSYTYMNVLNLSFDAIILIYYFFHFCYEVIGDSEKVYFYTLFRKKCAIKKEVFQIRSAPFMAFVKCSKGNYFIFIDKKRKNRLIEIFGEASKK